MVPVDTVFFAVQSALRLASAFKTAYVEATINRPLVLPLPAFTPVNADSARDWFRGEGKSAAADCGRVGQLLAKPYPSDEDQKELVEIYNLYYHPSAREFRGELRHAFTIRMWANDEAGHPSPLQRVAGTLVNVAVDYFATSPGAVSERHPQGRALKAFLGAIDDTDFSSATLKEVAGDVLTGVLDAAPTLARGPKESLLLSGVSASMAAAATDFLANANSAQLADGSAWLGLAANALIRGGSDVVLSNPELFLGEKAALAGVGRVVADLVVGEDAPTFRNLLSGPGLETVSRAALGAVAAHPELLEDKRLKPLLVKLAGDLSTAPASFPEIARLVLARTSEELEGPLSTAVAILAKAPTLIGAAEWMLDEVVENPDWIPDGKLKRALETLGPLLEIPRLSREGRVELLRAAIQAASARAGLREDVDKVLKIILDVLFDEDLDADARWTLSRTSVAVAVGGAVFGALARRGYTPSILPKLKKALEELAADPETFAVELVEAKLEALLKKKGKTA